VAPSSSRGTSSQATVAPSSSSRGTSSQVKVAPSTSFGAEATSTKGKKG